MNQKENIEETIKILEKKYNYTERTTLNRMRGTSAFKILIACLLSLRARDETTDKISEELFKIADTPEKIANMETKKLEKIIFSSGHFHKKAIALKSVSRELIERFGGEVPRAREELISIKHIGPKTANIVLNFAFGECVIPVDVNVHRIANRLGWVSAKTAEKTEGELVKIIPKKYWMELNGIFILHGRTICVPISPKCSICPVYNLCSKVGVEKSR